jgi:hypothetical protein
MMMLMDLPMVLGGGLPVESAPVHVQQQQHWMMTMCL